MMYRAAWKSEMGDFTLRGDLTDKAQAEEQVKLLKKYREAWLEDENFTIVEEK